MTSLLRELMPLPIPAVPSRTIVSRPRSASSRAIARPTAPAPTTMASTRSRRASSLLGALSIQSR
jgi:hypothetical protein